MIAIFLKEQTILVRNLVNIAKKHIGDSGAAESTGGRVET
jgi:hypothetical protein